MGKTTQFRAVMSAISLLPEETRPRVIGLAPTHRAVGEMQSAGVDARTTASFLHDTQQLLQRNGQTPDFSNTLFLLDESSMVGLADMAKAHSLIAAGGGRAVPSGDTDQLPPIASGQPVQADAAAQRRRRLPSLKEIVRQMPELRPAVYSLIERDVHRALTTIEQVTPEQVPRKEGAWAPGSSVVEFTPKQEKAIEKALSEGKTLPEGQPATLYEALVKDYTNKPEAQSQTLVITHLNKDRRALNSLIHDARRENGETGKEEITLPVLVTSNIRDGELRKLSTWTAHKEAVALVDNVYHRISKVDKDNQLITLTDSEGKERFISPREASAEGVTLYRQEKIAVFSGGPNALQQK
ncbi:AAA family ATPase [Klebsiella pneumoniae]